MARSFSSLRQLFVVLLLFLNLTWLRSCSGLGTYSTYLVLQPTVCTLPKPHTTGSSTLPQKLRLSIIWLPISFSLPRSTLSSLLFSSSPTTPLIHPLLEAIFPLIIRSHSCPVSGKETSSWCCLLVVISFFVASPPLFPSPGHLFPTTLLSCCSSPRRYLADSYVQSDRLF
ncbi:hypothetical protein F4825DRAFT_298378 [Nemania diffusa]|nr:hypothetical protein F4825DRAFT_298378 [Nemania diffusa]